MARPPYTGSHAQLVLALGSVAAMPCYPLWKPFLSSAVDNGRTEQAHMTTFLTAAA